LAVEPGSGPFGSHGYFPIDSKWTSRRHQVAGERC
jgi:hypothetical protein